ncbi:MAG: hypothetical protein SFV18_00015, partial [Bryobacteraceae bacterium]|nr:hypothetical protein [Bryobacteraceae bacterium]
MSKSLTPVEAVDALEAQYAAAAKSLAESVSRFIEKGVAPTDEERARFRYPELRISHAPTAAPPRISRAYGQLIWPGDYAVSVTQPAFFRPYLLEQLGLLVSDYGATVSVGTSATEIPYAFVLDGSRTIDVERAPPSELARHFPFPQLAAVGDAVVDGQLLSRSDGARPLALFD